MSALEFGVWGAYLTSMSNYMGSAGMGQLIAWFFAIQGLVCLIMPAAVGVVADKYVSPTRLLGVCQLLAGIFMLGCWYMGYTADNPDKTWFTVMFTLSSAFFMPTVALSNTIAFKTLRQNGYDTVKSFPQIRIFGTVGFITAMLFVNCAYITDNGIGFALSGTDRFQYQYWQFLVSAIISLLLFIYSFTLPYLQVDKSGSNATIADKLGLNTFGIFRSRHILVFFIFSMLMGMCLKVTNGFAGPFITSFMATPLYATTFGAENATLLTAVSQASEALCILLIPFFLKRYGIKAVLIISMLAWSVRFESFALGNPGSGLWLLILSMVVYGIAFDFFNIAGAIYLERVTDKSITASAQGLWMTMANGIGASVGTVVAGYVIDHYCHWVPSPANPGMSLLVGDWNAAWSVFALFALATAVLFSILFRPETKKTTAALS